VSRDVPARRLLRALEQRDDVLLASVLHVGARLVVDSGDPTGGAFRGRAPVARALRARLTGRVDASLEVVDVNGAPGVALRTHAGAVIGVLGLDPDRHGRITHLWLSTSPSKLAHWNR
jgi:hypothetical protein